MKVIFLGNGFEYSLHFMAALAGMKGVELVAIVSPVSGERRSEWRRIASSLAARLPSVVRRKLPGGDEALFPSRAVQIAHRAGARLMWPDTINDGALVDELFNLEADVVVMAGFNEILKPEIINGLPPVINIHPSLLPQFRGPHPEFWIIAEGAQESGVTLHLVDKGIDTGPILAQRRFAVEPWLTGGALQQRAMTIGADLLAATLDDLDLARAPRWPQQGPSSYFPKVDLADIMVPFNLPASLAYARARAASPWIPLNLYVPTDWWIRPAGASSAASQSAAHGLCRLNLARATPFPDHHLGPPGTVVRSEDGGMAVACNPGALHFAEATSASP